ncbi:DNA alkylation repair protein [Brachybacterium sp. FME24]|uniref:DNA alkylation repair protein n=1 Tax=Brachybacterium sp. FME24 TaxID=2742605 RepID=UPI0018690E72|nr:DNA alkylation repair protein [Brachybacterium sp. FME24]
MPFADEMIDRRTALDLADALEVAAPGTSPTRLRTAAESLSELSLRERVDALRAAMLQDLGGPFTDLATVVRRAIRDSPTFRGWMIWPVSTAVAESAAANGSAAATADALDLLAELTGLLTSEFALRTLLRHDLEHVLAQALEWTHSQDEHVRRLASEGTRPYLPWAVRVPRLTAEPGRTIPILDRLHRDPSEYVRRSVANHLNDLSRDDPALVVATTARWLGSVDAATEKATEKVVRHALRTLLKRGDPAALALLGYPDPAGALVVDGPHLDRARLVVGESIELQATVRNTGEESVRLMIDYVVHHATAAGTQSTKAFKLTTLTLGPGQERDVRKVHSFRPITTRRYYSGPHAVALQINGVTSGRQDFHLDLPAGG